MSSASERAGKALGTRVTAVRVRDASDIARALSIVRSERIDGVIVDLAIGQSVSQILELTAKRALPTISGRREFVLNGGLLAYGADYPDLYRRAAAYVDKIARGANPGSLPVQQPTRFELIVNLRTASTLGVTIPESVLARADEVIR